MAQSPPTPGSPSSHIRRAWRTNVILARPAMTTLFVICRCIVATRKLWHPSPGLPLSPEVSRLTDDVQGGLATRGFPFLKISLALSHLVRHVGKTDDLVLPGLR